LNPEQRGAGRLYPQPQGGLVHRHEPTGVKRDEEEVAPTGEHALHGGGVVQVCVAFLIQPEEVEKQGEQDDTEQRDSMPRSGRARSAR
jgi:hypothetical protein